MSDADTHPQKELTEQRPTDLDVDRFYHGYALVPEEPGYLESVMVAGRNEGQVHLVYADRADVHESGAGWTSSMSEAARDGSHAYALMMKSSDNAGRSWSEPWSLLDGEGKPVRGFHYNPLRLPSGLLGLVYSAHGVPGGHPGRNFGTVVAFRTSEDEGHTWSEPVRIDSHFGCCPAGHAIVLSSGRIVAPAFRWISPLPGNEAEASSVWDQEGEGAGLSYSYAYVSDDEGKTWQMSLSELFVSVSRAAYDLEEPTAVELRDGRLLMHLRSQLGRMYRSFSNDEGITWSNPEPLDIASSYCPQLLTRMPTGDLLMVWNQSSRQEIVMGLHRHRLSTAVSKDEGQTWGHFKNLESLDERTEIPPPPRRWTQVVEQYERYGYRQPGDLSRYPRAPGVLRICYPNVLFRGDEAIIIYDYGYGTLSSEEAMPGAVAGNKLATKLRAVPVEWFTA